jgi:pyruvate,orthophosphate dikinase
MTRTYPLEAARSATLEEARMLVGGKAANLGVMIRELGLPVPPGFVITTATCRKFLAEGWPAGLDAELHERMTEVEAKVGRRFADPSDPLLVSVRSGAPISMPGMMDTILDLGLNEATTIGLGRASGSTGFARACRRRFEASFRSIVGVQEVPDDPWRQLRAAIEAVFHSWNSDRAVAYRRKERIPDDLGTAVTVQAMVFGNRGPTSATGVVFTRSPATGETGLYGDLLFEAQGEDVVAGTHVTEPIGALDERIPDIAAELRDCAARLERHYADMCDIEFTIEAGRLWLLQVRVGKRSPQAALRIAIEMAEDPSFPLTRAEAIGRVRSVLANPPAIATAHADHPRILFKGLPASPGVASGPIALTPEAAEEAAAQGRAAILVRAETSPEDVHGMAKAAGILTSRGGLASHAAVVARGWGIPAVVGATGLDVQPNEAIVRKRRLRPNDVITIDGSTGEVFEGEVGGSTAIVPEAGVLREWARELDIAIDDGKPEAEADRTLGPAEIPQANADACIRAVAVKGFAPLEGLADALVSNRDAVRPIADQLVADGLAARTAGAYRLTDAGTVRATELLQAERDAWGAEAAAAALDVFLDLDHRVKDTVTAWQMRDPETLNDHLDADYDQAVLNRLEALHDDAVTWLTPLESACPRLSGYRLRLARTMEHIRSGDQRFIASPRVDSFHTVWFELHEDLIQLAGRTRENEASLGRG